MAWPRKLKQQKRLLRKPNLLGGGKLLFKNPQKVDLLKRERKILERPVAKLIHMFRSRK